MSCRLPIGAVPDYAALGADRCETLISVVAWLRFVLVDHPEAVNDRRRPLDILDGLVRRDEAKAIALQQEIES